MPAAPDTLLPRTFTLTTRTVNISEHSTKPEILSCACEAIDAQALIIATLRAQLRVALTLAGLATLWGALG